MSDQNDKELPKDQVKKPISWNEIINSVFLAYGEEATKESEDSCIQLISDYLKETLNKYKTLTNYNVLIHYDQNSINKGDADSIYESVVSFDTSKPILYVIYSRGGSIGTAYLIGKLLREHCDEKISFAIPRIAKSAATLLCCVADEIHMGSLSELGPIDPQLKNKPVLGLKNAIEHLAQLVSANPGSSEMFAKYLNLSIDPINIGYYERVAESAVQYAERLLKTHKLNMGEDINRISNILVYTYKDHGFVIDKVEAISIFGNEIVRLDTDEYRFSNEVYSVLNLISAIANYLNHEFTYIGSLDSKSKFSKVTN
ncbi:SDH family Clp fold serine proteinase [Leptospira neocaledonica]|uniref:Serine protease n=1 Tax=Leptospira neocaledonica TaxID=2023192 RepID=A0A2M9ZTE4_9LEPT|nr:serine dehydrogenasease [Leptospira neocaledonica]PJZ75264.1 hypothetical protein CH365_19785 [Leptospira neocaledonica]